MDMTERYRLKNLKDFLSPEDLTLLENTNHDDLSLADNLIENAVGYFQLPLAFIPGIDINDKSYPLIPIVTEETSVVAALSTAILFMRKNATIKAIQKGDLSIGQIHFPRLKDPAEFITQIGHIKSNLILKANQGPCSGMIKRGGGVQDIMIKTIDEADLNNTVILHVMIDTKDAMGANIINQTCEFLRYKIEEITQEKALMAIVSNYNTEKITQVTLTIKNIDPLLAASIQDASLIASYDPYRAVTHNKGIMNGIDGLCLATGNDLRALEACIHAYASHLGIYRSISQWKADQDTLTGIFEAPLNLGMIGGITRTHPIASLGLKLTKVDSSKELAYLAGAVGLIQNFAALKALVGKGINEGHMRLHFKNLLKQAGIEKNDHPPMLSLLNRHFQEKGYITTSDIKTLFNRLKTDILK